MSSDFSAEIPHLRSTLESIEKVTDLDALTARIADLEKQAAAPDLWDDPEAAQKVTSDLSHAQAEKRRVSELSSRIDDLEVMVELGEEEGDAQLAEDAETELASIRKALDELEVRTMLSGEYDQRNAVVTIRAGAGGVDAADFAEMLLRMYLRWAEHKGYPTKIDVFRSSGPGGQSVNTTDSAVRMTHIPTGIVVSMQDEKSQIQNRAAALRVLQSRLLLLKKQEEDAKRKELAGDIKASWGDQMRSYVLNPYQMVKDLRTEYSEGNPSSVFDGNIDGFIEAGIRWRVEQSRLED